MSDFNREKILKFTSIHNLASYDQLQEILDLIPQLNNLTVELNEFSPLVKDMTLFPGYSLLLDLPITQKRALETIEVLEQSIQIQKRRLKEEKVKESQSDVATLRANSEILYKLADGQLISDLNFYSYNLNYLIIEVNEFNPICEQELEKFSKLLQIKLLMTKAECCSIVEKLKFNIKNVKRRLDEEKAGQTA